MGRKVLRFDGALGPEGCGSGFAADFEEKGRGFAAGCVEGLCSLRSGGDSLSGRGLWWRPSGADYKKSRPAPSVISTVAERSGEISPSDGTGGITVGDLSTQSIIKAFSICPIPTRSPARDDGGGERPPSFRPKRSGVEKSHSSMVKKAWRQEISRLRVSWARFPSVSHSGMRLRRENRCSQ